MSTATRPMTFDRLKSTKKPSTRSIRIALDTDVQEEFEEATQERDLAKMMADGGGDAQLQELKEATERYRLAQEALRKNSVLFKFRSIGRRKYDDLVLEHPVTEANKQKMTESGGDPDELGWNPDTFPQALIAASAVEPEISKEQVLEMWDSDDWSGAELMALFQTALFVNTQNRVVDLGKD